MEKLPYINDIPESSDEWFAALRDLARYLRSDAGCPWDRCQTARSFAEFAQGEVEELLEAFDEDDNTHVEEEFGDCLFTLLASGVAAEAEGRFTLRKALERCHEKIVRRHGHVFGGRKAETPEEVVEAWHRIKEEEHREKTGREG